MKNLKIISNTNIEELINKQPLGSIERLFIIFCYGATERKNASFRCINKRLNKMSKDLRINTCSKLSFLFSKENFIGNTIECKHYFKNGYLILK